jgi:dihydrodipicolinate synthase/N-acetylneuraminate lyase
VKITSSGVIPAVVTPLNEDETVDVASLEKLLEWVLRWGVKGVLVGGAIGEGAALRDKEGGCLVRETVRLIRGRVPVLASVSDTGTIRAKDNINQAAAARVDAVVVTARLMFPSRTPGDTHRMIEALALHSPAPVWFYDNRIVTPVMGSPAGPPADKAKCARSNTAGKTFGQCNRHGCNTPWHSPKTRVDVVGA